MSAQRIATIDAQLSALRNELALRRVSLEETDADIAKIARLLETMRTSAIPKLEAQARELEATLDKIRALRARIAQREDDLEATVRKLELELEELRR